MLTAWTVNITAVAQQQQADSLLQSGVSLAQLATPDTGAEVCEQASKLLTQAAASKQQIKLPQRDAVAKLVSRRDWAVRATALLKRAQQQLDDNTAAVAAGIRSSKQKRVAREDFQALLSEATKQVLSCRNVMQCYTFLLLNAVYSGW
jgi:hypothetical protein